MSTTQPKCNWIEEESELQIKPESTFELEADANNNFYIIPKKGKGLIINTDETEESKREGFWSCELEGGEPWRTLKVSEDTGKCFRIIPETEMIITIFRGQRVKPKKLNSSEGGKNEEKDTRHYH